MTLTFIRIDLDLLCRYSGILSYCYSMISVKCIKDACIFNHGCIQLHINRNQQNGNIKSETAIRLKDFFVWFNAGMFLCFCKSNIHNTLL